MLGAFMLSLTYTAMSVDVYVDVLFLINAGMDCLCLSLAARLLHHPMSLWRLL
ncbi:MAG: sigma-E processing peptidase SpoIIGA, partial [Clostridia bacterium]|nr:sigma-E processing peptidase SpoIIGA [Clostridia bacterium]